MRFDVAVVGGGLGGMTAAAKLSRMGLSVFLAEKNETPGGNASMVERDGFAMEVALHQLYGAGRKGSAGSFLYEDLDIVSKIEFIPLPDFLTVELPGVDFTYPMDPGELEEALSSAFPHERTGIRTLLEHGRGLKRLHDTLRFIEQNEPLKLLPCSRSVRMPVLSCGKALDSCLLYTSDAADE